jgi:hypothetical protein
MELLEGLVRDYPEVLVTGGSANTWNLYSFPIRKQRGETRP